VGLLVDGVPVLRRVRQSAFSPVPAMYLTIHRLKGISSIINSDPRLPEKYPNPMFLLAIEMLLPKGRE
jgi:hypothetical protein